MSASTDLFVVVADVLKFEEGAALEHETAVVLKQNRAVSVAILRQPARADTHNQTETQPAAVE